MSPMKSGKKTLNLKEFHVKLSSKRDKVCTYQSKVSSPKMLEIFIGRIMLNKNRHDKFKHISKTVKPNHETISLSLKNIFSCKSLIDDEISCS